MISYKTQKCSDKYLVAFSFLLWESSSIYIWDADTATAAGRKQSPDPLYGFSVPGNPLPSVPPAPPGSFPPLPSGGGSDPGKGESPRGRARFHQIPAGALPAGPCWRWRNTVRTVTTADFRIRGNRLKRRRIVLIILKRTIPRIPCILQLLRWWKVCPCLIKYLRGINRCTVMPFELLSFYKINVKCVAFQRINPL